MKKIGLIAPANLKYVPYYKYYTDILDEAGVDYDIISWNRAEISENVAYALNYPAHDFDRRRMLLGYFKFGRFCRKVVARNNYDKIIFFTVAPAFFCGAGLIIRYKGRFILDIRDYSPIVNRLPSFFKRICNNAYKIVVSSPSFNDWVQAPTLICHNADIEQIKKHLETPAKIIASDGPWNIVFAGMMIEPDMNIEILNHFANNGQLAFSFVGRDIEGKQKIIDYVKKNNISNVAFGGAYQKEDIVTIYREQADLVNIFRANTMINQNALPNKLYDAVISGVPVVVFEHNKAIVRFVGKYNLGIVLKENQISDLLSLIKVFDYKAYSQGRGEFLNSVLNDMESFKGMLNAFIGD